ncbi:MAG TPA: hypothetical protein PK339_02325 [Flavitalea sp.]|nr:hypothetical protein [Flavitalea sp.]
MPDSPLHKFHIPVMGLAFTIDSPIKVARFGIASVISIMEDRLIEMMRSYYYPLFNQPYKPITTKEDDYRAKRITDYLNLVNNIVQQQIAKLRNEAFEAGSEIIKYFEMLPDDSKIKQLYRQMTKSECPAEKEKLQTYLRTQVKQGSIDVNVMTKIDQNKLDHNGQVIEDGSDAVTALRGYANSDLVNSSIVFSAGLNPRLYNYLEKCPQFDIDEDGMMKKKVVVKVSDFRSALIQGKYLAKKGIWTSEFRIESGLNCGGHAFATDGLLMGPILEEFKTKKQELIEAIFSIYNARLREKRGRYFKYAPHLKISAQGGIGTAAEDRLLHSRYEIESTGWGTPFLLVPEATTVDGGLLKLLGDAKKENIVLSNNSPLGVRFHYLKGTVGESIKLQRIKNGKPGSPCAEKHLVSNTEFTEEPICTASYKYQRLKIAQLHALNLPENEFQEQYANVVDKECLCVGLSNTAGEIYNISFIKGRKETTICPGPNIAWFSRTVSLQTMTDHIYGRENIIADDQRPHMFITELNLYVDYLKEEMKKQVARPDARHKKYCHDFYQHIIEGIVYYRALPVSYIANPQHFHLALNEAEKTCRQLMEIA